MLKKDFKFKFPLIGLLISQFVGAFNDNAWKLMVFTLATRSLLGDSFSQTEFEYESQMKATVALMVFLLPMLVFSLPAGPFSDRRSKRDIMIWMKALEVGLMGLASLSLFIAPAYLFFPYLLLGLMGVQSAFFSPAKYGILPQILSLKQLSRANGLVEMFTMIAIIAGTGLGTILLAADKGGAKPGRSWIGPFILMCFSFIGFIASFTIPKVSSVRNISQNVSKTLREAYASIRTDRILLLAILGNVFLWTITSLLGQNVLVYAKALVKNFEKGELFQGLPPASFGLGIALGALVSGRVSGDRIEYGLIPFGAIGFAIMSMILGVIQPEMSGTVVTLIMMGFFAGILIVPLKSIVQWRAPEDQRGSVIALGNAFDILGMIVGSLFAASMAFIGMDLGRTLIASSFIVVLATLWSVRLLPEALTRLFFIILTTTFYKIRIFGRENIPKEGAALLVANHLSVTDAFFVMAAVDRPVRFIINEFHYNKWWFKPFALAMDAIPVPYSADPETFKKAMRQAGKLLKRDHILCIFPEGQVSRTGMMQPFCVGVEKIIEGRSCPIIPINLDRVWGTIFSPKGGRYIPRRPQSIPHPMSVSIGKPLPPDTCFTHIRNEIKELGCNAWMDRKDDEVPIHLHFMRSVWRAPWKLALVDCENRKISRLKVLTSSIVLARLLKEGWENQKIIGILLPPSLFGVLINLAATITGRTVVNLNYVDGEEELFYCIKDSGIQSIITSREFLQKFNIDFPDFLEIIYLEDIKNGITSAKKFSSMLLGLLAPKKMLETLCGSVKDKEVEDLLTVIYTRGITTQPKGVMLSHFNISSNVEGVSLIVPATNYKDKLLHSIPLSHSFGYMAMWLGLNHGLPLILHPDPLDTSGISNLIKDHKATMLWTTPLYLKVYTERIMPKMFGSLRFVLTGTDKLPLKVAEDFKNRFGINPLEGYGATECSSLIAASTLDVRLPGIYQVGSIKGAVGQALPGVRVKIIDPLTFQELPRNEEGLLLVQGPNIMQGYLGKEDLSASVLHGGWYETGDMAKIDENDYIYITDRLTRFSKIGGIMVPHNCIEKALYEIEQSEDLRFVVTSVSNQLAEEKLIVLHTLEEGKIHSIYKKLFSHGLPKAYIPHFDNFIKIEQLPRLTCGNLDYKKARYIALEKS